MNVDQLEEMNDNSNPFKIMRNKIKIERLIEKNHDEVFIDQIHHLRKLRMNQGYLSTFKNAIDCDDLDTNEVMDTAICKEY